MAIETIETNTRQPAVTPKSGPAHTREIIQVDKKVPLLQSIPLSLQHLFAMFGASILVTLLFNTYE